MKFRCEELWSPPKGTMKCNFINKNELLNRVHQIWFKSYTIIRQMWYFYLKFNLVSLNLGEPTKDRCSGYSPAPHGSVQDSCVALH